MKIIPSRRALLLLVVCLALAAPAWYLLRRFYTRVVLGMSESEVSRVQMRKRERERESRAAVLLREAKMARPSAPDKAVKLLQTLRQEYPETYEAGEAVITLAEMASTGEAPAAFLQEIYDQMLARQGPRRADQRNEAFRYLEKLDASHEWPLRWQVICDSAKDGAPASVTVSYLKVLLDSARFYRSEASVPALLLKAVRNPELKNVHGTIARMLLQATEQDKGAGETLTLAREIVRERSDSEAGLEAFGYACDTLERLKGDKEVFAFLEQCTAMQGNGLVQGAARARLAAHYIEQKDIETAVSWYCGEVKPQSVLSLPPQVLREAVDRMVTAVGRKGVTTASVLQFLGTVAAERKLYGICRDLYAQAAASCHPPELKVGNEAETAFTEPDAIQFWQAYLLWHQGEKGQGRERYEPLLARYNQGWQVAQMMYDLAVQSLQQFRLEEAVEWAGKAAQVLPKSRAMLDFRKSCEETLAADRPLAVTVAELQEVVKSATKPEAKAEGLMKIAETQFQRKRYDEGVRELRQVWEEFPRSSFAPKAMFRAAEVLGGVPDRKAEARRTLEDLVMNHPTNELSPRAFDFLKKLQGSDLRNEVYDGTTVSRSAAEESAASDRSRTEGESAENGDIQTDALETPEANIPGAAGDSLAGESRRAFYESAAESLTQEGRQNQALDVIAHDLQGQATRVKLRELLSASKARCDQELPTAAARILPSAETYVGLQALARILRYRVVNAEGVEELCRVLKQKAPASRAAMLATLSQAEQAIWKRDVPGALRLLAGLSDSHIPLEIRAKASEYTGDCFFLQGNFREADNEYREAAEGYVYEQELPGFGFFGLKKHPLSDDAPSEAREVDSRCLKGYLLLAQGQRYEGLACLNQALARLNRFPGDSEISRLRTADVHLLLAGAYWAEGDRHLWPGHGEMALRHLLQKAEPQPRADLLAFAELLCRSVFEEAPAAPRSTGAGESDLTLENVEVAVVREAKIDEARKVYQGVLRKLTRRDVKTVLAVCNGVILCLVKERPQEGLETALFHFRAWAARSLPDEYEGCASLAVAKAYYLNNNLVRALEEVRAYLELGTDEDLMIHAQLLAGLIHFRAGRPAAAVRSFEEVLARNPPQPEINLPALFLMGEVNLLNGNTQKAQEIFGVLVKKYPDTEYAEECADVLAGLKIRNSEAGDSVLNRAARAPAKNE